MGLKINNRRYIGSKTSILPFINDAVFKYYGDQHCTFADVFAGTGVVAYDFWRRGYDVVVNDLLYSNYVAYKTWFGEDSYDVAKINNVLEEFNGIDGGELEGNYFSEVYGGKYFAIANAKKIGFLRDRLEEQKGLFTEREYYILLASLMYATDKIANTVGHFESYLRKEPQDMDVVLKMPELIRCSAKVNLYNEDANKLIRSIKADILYIDPPYNARQYVNFYHVLENLARWEKPTEFEGDSMKFKRDSLKSGYSRAKAPALMEDLISNAECKLIIVSYNNTYNARSGASNNKIQEDELVNILEKRGSVNVEAIDYRSFNAGKTDLRNHQEKLYICEVNNAER